MGAAVDLAAVTLEEVRELWRACAPLAEDLEVLSYGRAFGWSAEALDARGEARLLPLDLPGWAAAARGYRVALPLYAAGALDPEEGGALGVVGLAAAWCRADAPPPAGREVVPLEVPPGAVLANWRARLFLAFDGAAPAPELAVVEPERFLVAAGRGARPVLAPLAGALPEEVAARLPAGALAVVDVPAARAAVRQRCTVLGFPGGPLSDEERAAVAVGIGQRLAGRVLHWTGERWTAEPHDEVPAADLPRDLRWFTLAPREGRRASKAWTWTPSGWTLAADFDAGAWFDVRPVDVAPGVEGLHDLFARLAADPGVFLVTGLPARAPGQRGARRVVRTVDPDGEPGAWLAPHPIGRRGVVFDVDKAAAPAWLPEQPTAEDLARAVREVVQAQLPRPFHGAACAFRWSASAGIRPWRSGLSLHLAFWLARPLYAAALYEWAKSWRTAVDPKVALPGQPVFTAAPLFDGAADPLEAAGIARVGLLVGAPAVMVPADFIPAVGAAAVPLCDGPTWHAWRAEEAAAVAWAAGARRGAGAYALDLDPHADKLEVRARGYAARALRGAVDRLLGTGRGGRHDAALLEATAVARFAPWLEGGAARVAADLLAAFVAVAGESRRAEGARTIATGIANTEPLTRADMAGKLKELDR